MDILIKNGHLLDPDTGRDGICDIYVADGKIADSAKADELSDGLTTIDAAGCYVMPGLIDLHVHLRDPGFTYKEDLKTGSTAAAHGGFTTIVAMANTKPVIDTPEAIANMHQRAKSESPIHVLQTGTLTYGMKGEEVTDIEGMKAAGAMAISEDGRTVMNASLFREAAKLAAKTGLPILDHCEDENMKGKGAMNECSRAKELGVQGITNAVEDVIIARDLLIAKETGAKLHLCHCSTKDSVAMIRMAKMDGIQATAEVCPHHFSLTSEEIPANEGNYKMAPPLRSKEDKDALIRGLQEGIIDVIATDHAPHSAEEKTGDMSKCMFGIVGLETAIPLTVTNLVKTGLLTPMQMAERMSTTPAKILGLDKGSLAEGKAADITIIDMNETYKIDKNTFATKGRNTPFDGMEVCGKVKYTICDGKIVYQN